MKNSFCVVFIYVLGLGIHNSLSFEGREHLAYNLLYRAIFTSGHLTYGWMSAVVTVGALNLSRMCGSVLGWGVMLLASSLPLIFHSFTHLLPL